MAVSIDKVYQKVLVFANKEQRGYITPQEFNLFADQAQIEIFEQYFYDINQWIRQHGNSTGHSDMLTNLEEKVSFFEEYDQNIRVSGNYGNVVMSEIDNLYRVEMVRVDYQTNSTFVIAEEIQLNELNKYGNSPLGRRTKKRPVYIRYAGSVNTEALRIYPYPEPAIDDGQGGYTYTDRALISYIKKPEVPKWGYVVINEKAMHDPGNSTDFSLHPAEQSDLVYRILKLAGVAIKRDDIASAAQQLEVQQIQQEKQ